MEKLQYRRIQLWVPDFFGTGGIQHHSRMLARGLGELDSTCTVRVLSKASARSGSIPVPRGLLIRSLPPMPARFRKLAYASLIVWNVLIHRPDLIILTHLHFSPLALWLKRILGLRYWVAAHGLEITGPFRKGVMEGLRNAERVLPVSRYARELVLAKGVSSNRCLLLPNCVDAAEFGLGKRPEHLLRLYGLNSGRKVLLTLARLDARERYKGYDLVLEALPHLRELIPEIHYVLAGSGDDSRRIRHRIRELGLEKHVTMPGFLPAHTLRDHYLLCDLFVMPSRQEGFGIVFLEALACGRPVIAGGEDGSRDPLADGAFGKLIDPAKVDELIDAVAKSLLQPTVIEEENSSARRGALLEKFGFDAFKQRLAELIHS